MDSSAEIDSYVTKNPDCRLPKTVTIQLQGKRVDLQVYRLPLCTTFYNIKNGRFAAEYLHLVRQEGRELDPTNPKDASRIQDLLISLDLKQSKILEADLQNNGQRDPGIVTHDGFVINGNRRRAVLERLSNSGLTKFSFIEVARLPPNVSSKDLWKIEAGIQLSRNVQLDYGPINVLLKFKEGIDSGMKPIEIATALFGGFTENEIKEKLEQYKLITEYLIFIDQRNEFVRAKGIHEHFLYLHNILEEYKKTNPPPNHIVDSKLIGFQLIHDGVQAREFRKVKDILLQEQTQKEFLGAIKYSQPEPEHKKREKKLSAEENGEVTEARTIFNNCVDSIRAISEAEKPEKLLRRALKNLRVINPNNIDLDREDIISMVDEAKQILEKLQPLTKSQVAKT